MPRLPLPGLPGSIEFMAAYQSVLAVASPPPPSPRHVIAGSLAAVAAGYFRSADFANLSPSSQASYRVALKPVLAAHGHRLVRDLPKEVARHLIEEIGASRPGMANLTRSVLSKLMGYAIETRIRTDNPFAGLRPYRLGTYHTWTDAEIAQFERRWPLGTRERLAFALLLYTGQRGGDVVTMLRSDIVDGRIRVAQDKARKGTTNELLIPVHPALARALLAGPVVGMTHIITDTRGGR
jgi:integrase